MTANPQWYQDLFGRAKTNVRTALIAHRQFVETIVLNRCGSRLADLPVDSARMLSTTSLDMVLRGETLNNIEKRLIEMIRTEVYRMPT